MTMIDKVAWLYLCEKRILCTRTCGEETYYLPGGKREGNETDAQTLEREVREELSVKIVMDSVRFAALFEAPAHGRPVGTTVRMSCYFAEYTGELAAASEIEEIAWLTSADRARVSAVGHLIFDWLWAQKLLD